MSPQGPRRTLVRLLRIALLVTVPTLALAGWYWLQPDDRMTPPYQNWRWFLPSLLYDEFDASAMALRGMNAELGRQAGATEMPRGVVAPYYAQNIEAPRPRKDRYFLEYPHAALLLFRAGYWIQPGWRDTPIPPGLPDGSYHNIAQHDPETDDQFATWRLFVVATRFYAGVMFVALMLLIAILEWGYGPGTELYGGSLLLLLPGMLFFTLNRFDILPALLTAGCFACLGRRRVTAAALFLGLATVIKVYPILFAPLVLRYLWPERRLTARFALVYAFTGLLAFMPMLFGADWQAVSAPYKFQFSRRPEFGLTIYGCILPEQLANGLWGTVFRLSALATISALMLATPIRNFTSLLCRCSVVLMVFVSLAVFYSPQWIVWFAPLLLPMVRRRWPIGLAAATLDVITYLTFPFWYFVLHGMMNDLMTPDDPGALWSQIGNLLRISRFICSGFLIWYLVRDEYPWETWLNAALRLLPTWKTVFARK